MVEQLPQNNLDVASASAWEFQFQAPDLALTSDAHKQDWWEQGSHLQNTCREVQTIFFKAAQKLKQNQ